MIVNTSRVHEGNLGFLIIDQRIKKAFSDVSVFTENDPKDNPDIHEYIFSMEPTWSI